MQEMAANEASARATRESAIAENYARLLEECKSAKK